MKLLRYGPPGHERPGLPDGDTIRGLSGVAPAGIRMGAVAGQRQTPVQG